MRTPAASDAITAIAEQVPEVLVGAGTVLNEEHVHAAKSAGAQFVVSPGLSESVVRACEVGEIPCIPGVATASEVQRAWNLGLRTLKFFPAVQAGGPATIKALSSVFRKVRFIPTGGVTADNLSDFLALPSVIACGGSWLAPAKIVEASDFDAVENRAREALAIATESGG
jgi:2-dehydro-3-deoxyphosphogluconate aldolase/(4S)-4-hydroxy-2-oxoglutarate aldolase